MQQLSVADVLSRAADLIEPEGAWVRGVTARDAQGRELDDANAGNAVCWCVLGAISKAIGHGVLHPLYDAAAMTLRKAVPDVAGSVGHSLPPEAIWNDAPERQQSEVVAALRAAAELAKASS